MVLKEIECILEAVLFSSGESVSEKKLCTCLDVTEDVLSEAAKNLSDSLDFSRRGIKLIKLNDRYQLCSRPEYAQYVRRVLEVRKPQSLSQPALEALAIVAYKQPVTKAYIDQVRGVDSSYTVSSLVEKGLIVDCGRMDVPGRPILYKTTEAFLRAFSLSSLSELPDLPENDALNDDQLTLSLPSEVSV